ncbi:MAG: hypothetical protein RRB13_08955 [bacterium]|nr:hypothetical protein [bacterium]
MTESEYTNWVDLGHQLSDHALELAQAGRLEAAQDELARARSLFLRAGDQHWLAYVDHQRLGFLPGPQAWGLARQLEQRYRQCFDAKGEVLALIHSASLAASMGKVNQALARLWAAEALARARAPERLYLVLSQLGLEYLERQEYLRAAELLDQALHHGADEDPERRGWCFFMLGRAFDGIYRPTQAEAFYRKALSEALKSQDAAAVQETRAVLLDLEKRLNSDFGFSDLGLKSRSFLKERGLL